MIAFSPRLYRRLQALAERNHRPVQWEAELAIEAHLEANGISEDAAPASP
jgi:predicted transcriptional regulator